MSIEKLHNLVSAVCPINGVNSSREIDFKPEATQAQRDAALSVVAAYTPQVEASEDSAAESAEILNQARNIREKILNRLSGILLAYIAKGDTSHNTAIETARQGLLNMTADPRVLAATDGATTKAAVMAVYGEIASALEAADPASVSAFNGISL